MKTALVIALCFVFNVAAGQKMHIAWDKLLKKYVIEGDETNLVDYKMIAKDMTFDRYLNRLSSYQKSSFDALPKRAQMAFLINVYNAFTIKLVADNYPVKSIKKIGRIFSTPWRLEFIKLFGTKVSLDYIEHDLLRKRYFDPRIHFVVVCASISCPKLQRFAYTGDKLEKQLQVATIQFINNPKRNYLSKSNKRLNISKLFKWYKDDFTKKSDLKGFIKKYKKIPETVEEIRFLEYDWGLNELPPKE